MIEARSRGMKGGMIMSSICNCTNIRALLAVRIKTHDGRSRLTVFAATSEQSFSLTARLLGPSTPAVLSL